MGTSKVNSRLLYPRRGMVDTSADTHAQQKKWDKLRRMDGMDVEWIALCVEEFFGV